MNRLCLVCHAPLENDNPSDYHKRCLKHLFGTNTLPAIELSASQLESLAGETVNRSITIPGVQPKLSMHLDSSHDSCRLTIVGLWGGFIVKPPVSAYPALPENESAIMCLADSAGIETVPHGLIRFEQNEYAYISRRIDRIKSKGTVLKLHMEDFCQLNERLTHEKYNGSLESAAKAFTRYTTNPGYELNRFFTLILFSFLVGNADMHLKNFSLVTLNNSMVTLSPAYDLVSTTLAIPSDKDESALTINGKKCKLKRDDFMKFAEFCGIPVRAAERKIERLLNWSHTSEKVIRSTFLSAKAQEALCNIISIRSNQLRTP